MEAPNNTIIDRQLKQKEELIGNIKKTPIIQIACQKVGIGRATYYRWRKSDEAFAEKIDEALSEGKHLINDMAESQLIAAIKDRNMTAIIFWLKNHHKAYANKLELSGKIKTEIKLSPEEEAEIKRALKLASLYKDADEEHNN